jgi:hemerythrin superfamily protein
MTDHCRQVDWPGLQRVPNGMTAHFQGLRSAADQTEQQRGGARSILSRQSDDHAALHRLMLDYEDGTDPAARGRIVAELAERALRHAFAEETVLFPAYRKHLPDHADELTAHIEGEHQQINELLEQLQGADPSADDYDARVRRACELITSDAREEEDVLLPRLQQVVDDQELCRIGDAWETARTVSPTRPHPRIFRRPPGNLLAAGPLAVWDRLRDGLDRLPSPARTVAAGLVAGAAGVAVMTVAENLEQAFSGREDSYVPSQTLLALLGRKPRNRFAVNHAMHWGQGAALGVVRQLMTERGHQGLDASMLFAAMRFSADQTLENVTGVGSPPWTWPRDELVMDVAHKVVYAIVTGLVTDGLARS